MQETHSAQGNQVNSKNRLWAIFCFAIRKACSRGSRLVRCRAQLFKLENLGGFIVLDELDGATDAGPVVRAGSILVHGDPGCSHTTLVDQRDGVACCAASIDAQDALQMFGGNEHSLLVCMLCAAVVGGAIASSPEQRTENVRLRGASQDHGAHTKLLCFDHAQDDTLPVRGVTEADQDHGVAVLDQVGDVARRLLPGQGTVGAHWDDPGRHHSRGRPVDQIGLGGFGKYFRCSRTRRRRGLAETVSKVRYGHSLYSSPGVVLRVRPLPPEDTRRILSVFGV